MCVILFILRSYFICGILDESEACTCIQPKITIQNKL